MAGLGDRRDAAGAAGSVLLRHMAAAAARRETTRAALAPADPPPRVPVARTPDRAVASAVARAAERVHGMPLFFDKITTGLAVVAELPEILPEQALISVVEAPGDMLGAVAICPGLLTSLIEMQALGRISARPAVPRRPTRTDGAICTDFLNACLADLGAELSAHPGFESVAGYRYATFLDDPRPLGLMLEDVSYRLISMTLRAGPAGQRDGRMVMLLPAISPPAPAAIQPPAAPQSGPDPAADGVISDGVRSVPIDLVGILCRRKISLGELQSLLPGQTIALPPGALAQATLETGTGQTLFRGRLGELAGRHALRLAARDAAAAGVVAAAGAAAFGGPSDDAPPALSAGDAKDAAVPAEADNAAHDGVANGFDAGSGPPIDDLSAPDPFRDDAGDALPALAMSGFGDDESTELSAWEDAELPAIPMQFG